MSVPEESPERTDRRDCIRYYPRHIRNENNSNHLDLLLESNIVGKVEGTSPQRYRFNEEGSVS